MALLIDKDALPHSPTAYRFEGHDYGPADVSFFLVEAQPGGGPSLHTHPYAEVFVVLEATSASPLATRRSRRPPGSW